MGLNINGADKGYYIFASPVEYARVLTQKGFTNVICVDEAKLDDQDIATLKEKVKYIHASCFCKDENTPEFEAIVSKLKDSGLRVYSYKSINGETCDTAEEYAELLGTPEEFESFLIRNGRLPDTDYEGRCGNCQNILEPGDKYCRKCGTKRGEGKFDPYYNDVSIYYGSPTIYNYRCKACGTRWEYTGFTEGRYCPKCGRQAKPYKGPYRSVWDELVNDEEN